MSVAGRRIGTSRRQVVGDPKQPVERGALASRTSLVKLLSMKQEPSRCKPEVSGAGAVDECSSRLAGFPSNQIGRPAS